jgi:hypothetical protein
LVIGAGQFLADSVRAVADRAAAPFHELLNAAPFEAPATAAGGADAEKGVAPSAFGQLYRSFEAQLRSFLAKFPDLPSLRVQISSGGQFRLSPTDPKGVTAEELQEIGQAEAHLNDDFTMNDAAHALYEAKARDSWRAGMNTAVSTVELVVSQPAAETGPERN